MPAAYIFFSSHISCRLVKCMMGGKFSRNFCTAFFCQNESIFNERPLTYEFKVWMKRLPISSAPIFDDVSSEFFFPQWRHTKIFATHFNIKYFGGKWQKCVCVLELFPFHSWKNAQKFKCFRVQFIRGDLYLKYESFLPIGQMIWPIKKGMHSIIMSKF